ncbi:MAG: NADH-quinone oxidoreductase subunit NuoG [Gammaproteobacteria bacterium]|nr:NADH-quinone oxidoreductase subunit NuoG [Gammaproteobacteria bacterium]
MTHARKVTIQMDGRSFEVPADSNLLHVLLEKGVDLPYFCWHPALGSVGACRQCAVTQFRDDNDKTGRVVMACMTPCSNNLRVSLDHPEAAEMRKAVIEFLMTNHPHDCPVCEEGGHCHLQDMTVMTGHNYRRYRYTKRTHRNQDLGPFVGHEMNRCIACYRCVRYYKDYAGGKDLDSFGAHNHVYFGREKDGVLESEFAGNLVEVCPTGVFTDKTYGDSYTRKWDLQQAPSVCAHCSVGCNTMPGERYGRLKRIENRYHGELNGYFLCDRGRYGYQFVNREDRPRRATRKNGHVETLSVQEATAAVSELLKGGRAIGVGSPRASLEANHALRALVGAENFYQGESKASAELNALALDILARGPAKIAAIRDIERADAVLVLGEDVLQTGARVALALRQAVRQEAFKMAEAAKVPAWQDASVRILAQDAKSPLFVATPAATGIDEIATRTFRGTPTDVARLAQEVLHLLDPMPAPRAPGLSDDDVHLAHTIAEALKKAERPLIVAGTGCGSRVVLQEAANLCTALAKLGKQPSVSLVFAESNTVGATLLGGPSLDEALARVDSGAADTLVVLENDLYRRLPAARVNAALGKLKHLVVLDSIPTATTAQAEVILPAGSFAESDGTLVNFEGRAQRFFQVFVPNNGDILESWRWMQEIGLAAGRDMGDALDALTAACAASAPALAPIVDAAPSAKFRIAGLRIPRQSHRYSGRTAMHANKDVHEPRPPQDPDSPLAFSMEGARINLPPAEIPIFWAPRWNSPQATITRFQQEINGPLKGGDPGVRLLQPDPAARPPYFERPAVLDHAGLEVVALHHLFGSEEFSALGEAVRQRVPAAYVALNPATADRLKLADGATAAFAGAGVTIQLPVRLKAELPEDVLGVPAGLPGVPTVAAGSELKPAGGGA